MTTSLPARVLLLSLATLASAPHLGQGSRRSTALRRLSPAQMEEDLFQLSEELNTFHAGLLRYATQEELDEAFGEVLFGASEERSALEFYRLVAELVARFRCGHTRVRFGALDEAAALARRGLLPIEVLLRGERAWVRRVLVGDERLAAGDELLSIDGLSIAAIRARAFARTSADGFVETSKERQLERELARRYVTLVDELGAGACRLELAGRDAPLELAGLAADEYAAALEAAGSGARRRSVVALELQPEESLGVLTVSAFGDPGGEEPSFPVLLERAFERLREADVRHLVLDLRGNGGGRDEYGALLVSYLSPEPFGYFERIEVTEAYEGFGETRWRDGRRLMLSHDGLSIQQPAPLRFSGETFVLIDGWTFSTAADVATVAHHHGLATFVGEETGGGYDGNTSGVSRTVQLVHSGLAINVPRWMYTTANLGHDHAGRGVPPDHVVPGTIDDALAGRDAQLEHVRARIRAR